MDASMFNGAWKAMGIAVALGIAIALAGGFAFGWALRGCAGHPVVRWERPTPPSSEAPRGRTP